MSSDESKTTPGEETLAPSTPTSGGLTSASRGTRVSAIRPGARIAHYRIDRHLGAGGMGEVFAAWDLALDRAAAIKVIRPGFAASFTGRLLREVDACARLQHPAIATFFEGGEYQGRTYFAMELVNGTTLRERLSAGRIATRDGLAIASGVLEGLAHAHEAGILHRDIKPDNIVLTPRGVPKLLDFGLARCLFQGEIEGEADCDPATITNLTAHGSIPGTPGYMSPEQ